MGGVALGGADLANLMNQAVARVAQTLEVEYSKVLELVSDGTCLALRAGVGWRQGLVGPATVSTGSDSQAGYTLLSNEPVIVEDLRTETRFTGPPLLTEHGVVSGMSVIIHGQGGPFGVIGAAIWGWIAWVSRRPLRPLRVSRPEKRKVEKKRGQK